MQDTIQNRTIFCKDNIDILQGINSDSIDLIYLDPPFNKKKEFTAPIGSSAEGASFKDWFRLEDIKEEWVESIQQDNEKLHNFLIGIKSIDGRNSYNFCYIAYMAIRLIECHRVLKDTGSLYLHCDPTMSHYIKITLDCIFNDANFRNEIIWCYTSGGKSKKYFSKKHDIIFFYSKTDRYYFNIDSVRVPYSQKTLQNYKEGLSGSRDINLNKKGKVPEDYWNFAVASKSTKEYTGYPTQKPVELLKRIISASTNENNVVLDPFCGCATTCVAAEQLHRQWIGIDISMQAYELVKQRLTKEAADETDLLKYQNEIHGKTDAPKRTDQGQDYQLKKYVYVIANKAYPNEYKVGIASNWQNRLNSYQTSDPNRGYTIEYKEHTHKFKELEKHIHDIFPNRHEWVQADLNDIKKAIKEFLH